MQPPARPARPEDAAELVRLRALMYESMGIPPVATWQAHCRAEIADRLAGGDLIGAVVEAPDGAGLASSGLAELQRQLPGPRLLVGRHAHLLSFSTDPGWRRRGMARAVMAHLLARLTELGYERAELHATPTGEPLYRSMGFVARQGGLEMRLTLVEPPA